MIVDRGPRVHGADRIVRRILRRRSYGRGLRARCGGAITHVAINIDDDNVCTTDTCNAITGAVSHLLLAADDHDACTADACDPGAGMRHVPVAIDDADACTADAGDTVTNCP